MTVWPVLLLYSVDSVPDGYPRCLRCPAPASPDTDAARGSPNRGAQGVLTAASVQEHVDDHPPRQRMCVEARVRTCAEKSISQPVLAALQSPASISQPVAQAKPGAQSLLRCAYWFLRNMQ